MKKGKKGASRVAKKRRKKFGVLGLGPNSVTCAKKGGLFYSRISFTRAIT